MFFVTGNFSYIGVSGGVNPHKSGEGFWLYKSAHIGSV
jgi:hypothetical protein